MTLSSSKPIVKVCVHEECRGRGSERIYARLCDECGGEAEIRKTEDCFRLCKIGPNVAVNGNVLHHMRENNAVLRVRSELRSPSIKRDGIGARSLDDLDDVLDHLAP
jgi:NADH:ubiquinone oxidoreductase subunit E